MKRLIAYIITCIIALTSAVPSAFATDSSIHNRGMAYTAPKATIVVDGRIDDAWEAAEWTYVNIPYNAPYSGDTVNTYDYGGTEFRAKVLWDDEYIYVLAEVNNESDIFDSDIIEIYVEEGEKTQGGFSEYGYQIRFQYVNKKLCVIGGTNPTEFEYDEICPRMDIRLSNDGRTADMEFALRFLSPDGHKEGDVLGLEFMMEDYRKFGEFRSVADVFRWNVIEVDAYGPTGVTRPYGESLNYGDLYLADADGNIPEKVGIEQGSTWIIIIAAASVLLVTAVIVIVAVIRKKKKSEHRTPADGESGSEE